MGRRDSKHNGNIRQGRTGWRERKWGNGNTDNGGESEGNERQVRWERKWMHAVVSILIARGDRGRTAWAWKVEWVVVKGGEWACVRQGKLAWMKDVLAGRNWGKPSEGGKDEDWVQLGEEEGKTWLVMDEKGEGKTTLLGYAREEGRKGGRRTLACLNK